ncbi:FtsX-like permease family protein [Tistrella bauzanensis]|uniref:ABC transporter permease n=1 Tax=Tistrella TaxID=171436 RepID=UPI0031F71B4D
MTVGSIDRAGRGRPAVASGGGTPRRMALIRFALRDLRRGIGSFSIVLASLALGVTAMAGIGALDAAVVAGQTRDARALLGGDLELATTGRPLPDAALQDLVARADAVSAVVDLRAMARLSPEDAAARAAATPPATDAPSAPEPPAGMAGTANDRALVQVLAVDAAYPLVGRMQADPPLAGPPAQALGDDGLLVEAALLARLRLQPGDRLMLGDAAFRIVGTLTAQPDQGGFGFALGPRVVMSKAGLARAGLDAPGTISRHMTRAVLPAGTDAGGVVAALEAAHPEESWRARTLDRANPGLAGFVDRLATHLELVALAALAIGGIGVAGAARAHLEARARTIAVLKALALGPRAVFFTYVVQMLVVALVGVAIGVACGATVPWIAASFADGLLPTPILPALYTLPLARAALIGLGVAIAFTAPALGRAAGVRPGDLLRAAVVPLGARTGRMGLVAGGLAGLVVVALVIAGAADPALAAIAMASIALALGVFRLASAGIAALARRVRVPGRPALRLGVAGLRRPGAPTAEIAAALGAGLMVLTALALVQDNLTRLIGESLPERAPQYFFLDIQPDQVADFDAMAVAAVGPANVARMPTLRGRIRGLNGQPVIEADVAEDERWAVRGEIGMSWSATAPEGTVLTAGQWWPADYSGPPLVSIDGDLATGMGAGVGDSIDILVLGRTITAEIANLRRIDWLDLSLNFVMVLSPGALAGAPATHIATIAGDPAAAEALMVRTTDRFPNVSAVTVGDAVKQAGLIIQGVAGAVRITAFAVLAAGALVLAAAVLAAQSKRRFDAVMMKVVGASRATIATGLAIEFLIVALVVGLIGAAGGTLAAAAITHWLLKIDFVFSAGPVLLSLTAGIGLALAVGLAAVAGALAVPPARILRERAGL